jgi:hypothetical protein
MEIMDNRKTPKSNRTIMWLAIAIAVSAIACCLFYFQGWRLEERRLLQKLAELDPIATRPSEDHSGSVAILNNEAGYRSLEISMQLHDLRYANDASYRKLHDSLPKLSDLSKEELEKKLAKLDPDSATMNALHLFTPRSADKPLQDRSLPETQSKVSTSDTKVEYPSYSLDEFLIGIDNRREEIIDVSFLEDMLPDETVIHATGRSAQLVCGIRIVDRTPIMMLKVVHFQQRGILDVRRITVSTAHESISYEFDPKMVSRQSVDFGTIEFATMVPSHDKDAGNFLAKLVELAETCNVEVSGANDRFTTFAPTRQNTARTIAVADLYLKVLREPAWLDGIVKRALPNEVYLERIQGALSMGDLQ